MGLANADHTTLLLNTYTKLKDVARLDSFIKTESRSRGHSGSGEEELPFDLVTAIRVCRQAGYFEHASYLAKKYERHEDYLRIQIEDAGNYAEALAYLRKLGSEAVCSLFLLARLCVQECSRRRVTWQDMDERYFKHCLRRRHNFSLTYVPPRVLWKILQSLLLLFPLLHPNPPYLALLTCLTSHSIAAQ